MEGTPEQRHEKAWSILMCLGDSSVRKTWTRRMTLSSALVTKSRHGYAGACTEGLHLVPRKSGS